MIQDPSDELIGAVRRAGDDPSPADRRAVALVQRRFGLALPLPFAAVPSPGEVVPVRVVAAVDGPAIAATKWRSWRVAYRDLVPAAFLARLQVRPPPGYWTARAAVSPSRRHGLFVAGRKGTVVGLTSVQPSRDADVDGGTTADLDTCYVDPLAQRRGIGRALHDRAVDHARAAGATDLRLWVVEANAPARAFYEAAGWQVDGARQRFELEPGLAWDEVRYRYRG